MGYTDITILGSDAAADAYSYVQDEYKKAANKSIKILRKELKDTHSCFNTPGPANVAMIITEPVEDFDLEIKIPLHLEFSEQYPEFLDEVIDALSSYIDECKDPEVWDDLSNRDWHLKRYRQLLKKTT